MRLINRSSIALWGDQGRGAFLLVLATGAVFVLGLALQLIAVRALDSAAYATFVLALGLATIASMVASSVQPVVAMRVLSDQAGYLPFGLRTGMPTLGILTVAVWLALTGTIGNSGALLVAIQLPMHLAVGVLSGLIQGRRSFGTLSLGMAVWSASRVGAASLLLILGVDAEVSLLFALDAALFAHLIVLALGVSWSSACWTTSKSSLRDFSEFAGWLASGCLLFGDAIACRLLLPDVSAARYALAVTLGRQAVFAASPLSTVLLTTVQERPDDRGRLGLVAGIAVVLTVFLGAGVGIAPAAAVALLTGSASLADPWLIRGYVLVGGLGAAAVLLLAWAGGLGRLPATGLQLLALAGALSVGLVADSARSLLLMQSVLVVGLVLVTGTACIRRSNTPSR